MSDSPATESDTPEATDSSKDTAPPKGKAGIVSIAVMCSRVLGLVREIVLAALFGASGLMDCFVVAYRTPNMLRDLFAEGALSAAFVTTFSKKLKTEGEQSAWDLGRKMMTLAAVFMSGLTVLGILVAPLIVRVMALGFFTEPEKIALGMGPLTVLLAQIMYVFIGLVSLAALVMGMLNSKGVFFVPAISSSFFNLFSIISGVAIGYWLDPNWGAGALIGLSIGVVIGGLAQLGVQLPALRKIGFRFRPDFKWRDSAVKKVLTLMGPAVLAGSAVQAGVMLNTFFASYIEGTGYVTSLQWAFRLVQLPLGVFGVAVATVTLPAAARAATEGINQDFRNIIGRGIRLVGLLTIPSAVGLSMLAEPIIEVIFQRYNFNADMTTSVAAALRGYAIGLVFYSALKVLQPTFYAIDKKWVPMWVSLAAVAIAAGLNTLWVFVLDLESIMKDTPFGFYGGHEFLALSVTISAIFNFTTLYILMRKFAGHLQTGKLISTLVRLLTSAAALAGVIIAAQKFVLADWDSFSFILKVVMLLATIAVAAVVYFTVAKILRVEELDEFVSMVKRRVKR